MSTPPDKEPSGKSKSKKRKLVKIFAAIALVALAFFQDVLVESMPPDVKTGLETVFKKYPSLWYIAIGIIVISLIVSALGEVNKKGENEVTVVPANLTEKQRQQFIALLKKRYEGRKAQKMADRPELHLKMRYTTEGPALKHFLKSEALTEERATATLTELFQDHQHLLVLGEPGGGKTNSLLNLALEWLQTAEVDSRVPIPVIFNLAGWDGPKVLLKNWIKQLLQHGHSVPANLAASLLEQNKLVVLLDGLDEVGLRLANARKAAKLQAQCLEAISQFVSNQPLTKLILCSRRKEYELAGGKAHVKAQILIEPADWITVEQHLTQIKTASATNESEQNAYYAASNLLVFAQQYPPLKTVLCIPFYYNAALQSLYEKEDIANVNFMTNSDAVKEQLEALYISRTLSKSKNKAYPPAKIHHWLSWLAHWQRQRSSTSFELTDFQPKDLDYDWFFYWGLPLISSIIIGWTFGWVVGLISFVIFFTYGREDTTIRGSARKWQLKVIITKSVLKKTSGSILHIALIGSLIGAIAQRNLAGFGKGLFIGLTVGIILYLYSILRKPINYTEIASPYQRIKADFWDRLFLSTILFSLLALVILYRQLTATNIGLSLLLGIVEGTLITFVYSQNIQYSLLNYFLAREKKLPFRMARFFDYCANELHLLEKDTGGSWRFRHQIIQDYFLQEYRAGK